MSSSRPEVLFALVLIPFLGIEAEQSPASFTETFDDESEPTVLRERLGKYANVSLDPGAGPDGSTALRVVYRGNRRGSEGISESVVLGWSGARASLSYDVRFADDFDFSRGGKLPGLGPEDSVTGGEPMHPAGWSVRPMWREKGLLTSYSYHQDKPDRYGDYSRSDAFRLQAGRWHAVTVVVSLNSTPGERDGFVEIHVDGERRVEHTGLRFWKGGERDRSADISRLLFTTFHGGSDSSWAPKGPDGSVRDVVAWFDNVEVSQEAKVRQSPIRER